MGYRQERRLLWQINPDDSKSQVGQTTTDHNGYYILYPPEEGNYVVEAQTDGLHFVDPSNAPDGSQVTQVSAEAGYALSAPLVVTQDSSLPINIGIEALHAGTKLSMETSHTEVPVDQEFTSSLGVLIYGVGSLTGSIILQTTPGIEVAEVISNPEGTHCSIIRDNLVRCDIPKQLRHFTPEGAFLNHLQFIIGSGSRQNQLCSLRMARTISKLQYSPILASLGHRTMKETT